MKYTKILVSLIFVLCLIPADAYGCRCAERNLSDYFNDASSVTIGILDSIEEFETYNILHFVLMKNAYKGEGKAGEKYRYHTGKNTASCGVYAEPGWVFVLFASIDDKKNSHVNTCSGSRVLQAGTLSKALGFKNVSAEDVVSQLEELTAQ